MGELRHLVSAKDITRDQLESLHDVASVLTPPQAKKVLRTRVLEQETDGVAIIYNFDEPSTRTRMSSLTAGYWIGAQFIAGTENAKVSSSKAKGEDLENGIITLSQYGKKFGHAVLVIRDSEEGAAARAAQVSEIPIYNAGDGSHEHPSQAVLDTFTLRQRRGELDNRTFILSGDARNTRTGHSILPLLLQYKNNRFVIASPPELPLPDEYRSMLKDAEVEFEEVPTLSTALETTKGSERDIYFVRDQRERREREIANLKKHQVAKHISLALRDRRIRGKYLRDFGLTEDILKNQITEDDAIYHPLPEGGEVSAIGRYDLRNQIWNQVSDGVETRMAIYMWLMRIGFFKNGDYKKPKYAKPADINEGPEIII